MKLNKILLNLVGCLAFSQVIAEEVPNKLNNPKAQTPISVLIEPDKEIKPASSNSVGTPIKQEKKVEVTTTTSNPSLPPVSSLPQKENSTKEKAISAAAPVNPTIKGAELEKKIELATPSTTIPKESLPQEVNAEKSPTISENLKPTTSKPEEKKVEVSTSPAAKKEKGASVNNKRAENPPLIKFSPRMRIEPSEDNGQQLSIDKIRPFIRDILVVNEKSFADAPRVLGATEDQSLIDINDRMFVKGLTELDKGRHFAICKEGKSLFHPQTKEALGKEAIVLGFAKIETVSDVSILKVTKISEPILASKIRLISPESLSLLPSLTIKPTKITTQGYVLSSSQLSNDITLNDSLLLSLGKNDGVLEGDLFDVYREIKNPLSKKVKNRKKNKEKVKNTTLQKIGKVLIYRAYDKVAQALVIEIKMPIQVTDILKSPLEKPIN
ncbi:MAG: peptidoglycan-binding protein LysM [Francisellaceae bacterium]|nr:peptidoglycan-binding protein LysM [Francisellaceae bacterium]